MTPFRSETQMKRSLSLTAMLLLALFIPGTLAAATVGGKVAFVAKRGQHPIATDTLVWLAPVGKSPPPHPAPFLTSHPGKPPVPPSPSAPLRSLPQLPTTHPSSP